VTSGGPNIQEVDKLTEAHFRPTASVYGGRVREWIASTFRKLPDGALRQVVPSASRQPRHDYGCAKIREATWLKSLKP